MEAAHEKLSERGSGDLSNELFLKTDLDRLRKNEFLSIKINGTCCFKHNGYRGVYRIVKNLMNPECGPDDLDMALAYCQLHLTEGRKVYQASNMLKFAWYQDYGFLNKVCELCDETQVLVVIGYSFPFFNREIDRKIIRSMKALKKIYIQDRYPENISSRFLSILPGYKEHGIEIIPISDLSEFFLPPEL